MGQTNSTGHHRTYNKHYIGLLRRKTDPKTSDTATTVRCKNAATHCHSWSHGAGIIRNWRPGLDEPEKGDELPGQICAMMPSAWVWGTTRTAPFVENWVRVSKKTHE